MAKAVVRHYGKVIKGTLRPENYKLWYHQLQALEGKEYELVIKERFRKASNDQFGFYFGGILTSCFESEFFSHLDKPQDVHDLYFGPKFLTYKVIKVIGGKQVEVVKERSLSSLSKIDLADLIDRAIADCEMNGIRILSPHEYQLTQYRTIE